MAELPAPRRGAAGDTRAQLLSAAVRLLAARDVDGFSLRQVAVEAGFAPSAVYLHFVDKDDLLFQAAQEGFASFGAALARAAAAVDDPLARLDAIGRAYVAFGLAHPVQYRLMFMRPGGWILRPGPDHPPVSDGFRVLTDAIEAAMAAGAIPRESAARVANFLWVWTHGVVSLHLAMPQIDEREVEALMERGMRAIHVSLAAPPHPAPGP